MQIIRERILGKMDEAIQYFWKRWSSGFEEENMKDILHIFVEKVALNNSQYLILFLFLEFVHS